MRTEIDGVVLVSRDMRPSDVHFVHRRWLVWRDKSATWPVALLEAAVNQALPQFRIACYEADEDIIAAWVCVFKGQVLRSYAQHNKDLSFRGKGLEEILAKELT